jgi:hypothetical protein
MLTFDFAVNTDELRRFIYRNQRLAEVMRRLNE